MISILTIYIGIESFSQPGLEEFEGKIQELDFYRNENNTGPIVRIYAAQVFEVNNDLMEAYGNAMPHSKYGTTKVYFFPENSSEQVKLNPSKPFLSNDFQKLVLATYTKSSMGTTTFVERYSE